MFTVEMSEMQLVIILKGSTAQKSSKGITFHLFIVHEFYTVEVE